ncbi:hypothetical protein [Symmachiella dynata]|uniref:hypothetical protein n=1 Tax=Symmachiella dynata TaxID=2527995 RepID=UPI0030ED3D71
MPKFELLVSRLTPEYCIASSECETLEEAENIVQKMIDSGNVSGPMFGRWRLSDTSCEMEIVPQD